MEYILCLPLRLSPKSEKRNKIKLFLETKRESFHLPLCITVVEAKEKIIFLESDLTVCLLFLLLEKNFLIKKV